MFTVKKGFTLIELLIVIAILGVLAVVLLVMINPKERVAQAKDAGRISAVTQLGKSVHAFFVNNSSMFPSVASWDSELVTSGSPQTFPGGIDYSYSTISPCTANARPAAKPSYCYDFDDGFQNAIVYVILESISNRNRCSDDELPYFVFSTAEGRAGIICASNEPTPWQKGTVNFI